MLRFETHSHTDYSNKMLPDSTNSVEKLINYANELGLAGIAITDHGVVGSHVKAYKYMREIQKKNPSFKVGLGSEIYLCNTRDKGQKYYHFILIAKDFEGWIQLNILSSIANYHFNGVRPVTTKEDIETIIGNNKGHLIATSACLGGELSSLLLELSKQKKAGDDYSSIEQQVLSFLDWCKNWFLDDFYIECAPGCSSEQIRVNKELAIYSNATNIKMVVGTDSHYLKKEDRYVHKAYLNSKDGDREVDSFYEYSYLQSNEDIFINLKESNFDESFISWMFENSMECYNKIEDFSIEHSSQIPKVDIEDKPKINVSETEKYKDIVEYPVLSSMFLSDNKAERYWVNKCVDKLIEINCNNKNYYDELEEEADVKRVIGQKLNTNMFMYPITLEHYIDKFWELGSTVAPGRGSACAALNHYLLGITQLDPVKWNFPFFRYLNRERIELGDIDIDIAPSKRPIILQEIKKERGAKFASSPYVTAIERDNYGCTLIATFGTETAKSAVLTACRGYRYEDVANEIFIDGIDVDTAQYLSKLIPSERGFVWPLKDVYYGNPEKGRKSVALFVEKVNEYPRLFEIMTSIEGLVGSVGSHASGVILFDENPYEHCSFMRTPSGEIITQYDLHDCEFLGLVKYDFLVTEIQDKITQTIRLLQKDNLIDNNLSLREAYDKYLNPASMSLEENEVWDNIKGNKVLNCFQFDSDIGAQATKKIKPSNIYELTDANGLMRLMTSEPGEETPMDKYVRFKNNINLWYKEMEDFGLTKEEQRVLEPYFKSSYGVPPSQEQLMLMLMDENICHFTLGEANAARKVVGKKQMDKIPFLKEKVITQASSEKLGEYVWKYGAGPQMGYSFSVIHALSYSCIGYQSAFLATKWNPIYWNTACLIVNSGALEGDMDSSTDYSKLAKAIGDIRKRGIQVSLLNINESSFSFKPDVEHNRILFGMKALNGVGGNVIEQIIKYRPYLSFKDFLKRCPITKTSVISLIKAGAFDELESDLGKKLNLHPRMAIMLYYISVISEPKQKLNLQNFKTIVDKGLLPQEYTVYKMIFDFDKALKKNKINDGYLLSGQLQDFYCANFNQDDLSVINGELYISAKNWKKIYDNQMNVIRDWIKENQTSLLQEINLELFKTTWEKYGKGNLSSWEMDSLCFYYHEHELAHIKNIYGLTDFFNLSEESEVDYFFKRKGQNIPIYKISRIAGTVIAKNDTRSSISLLTKNGVVSVKFTKEYYAMFARQISEIQSDGSKKVMEKGWFTKGTKLICTGYRRDDQFVSKKYKATGGHQLYKILDVTKDGELRIQNERYGTEN